MGHTATRPVTARVQPKAADVANLFLFWANRDGDPVSHLKLQKLLYYAQAWHLVNFGRPLFKDPIEAWKYGPVVRSLYDRFRTEGVRSAQPIPYDLTKTDGRAETAPFSKREMTYLQEFYKRFVRFSAHDLVNMSHRDEPWKLTVQNQPIDLIHIKTFYTEMYKRAAKNGTALK